MNGHERRAAATREAVKDALLELLQQNSFNEISISALCRAACVGRATFYTHFTGLTDVLDELCDDAIDATKRSALDGVSAIALLAEKMQETLEPEALAPYMELLPVCQRVADHPKYKPLFFDPFVSEYMLMRIYRHERDAERSNIEAKYDLSPLQADKLFLFGISGAFAVNKSMGWKKDSSWYEVQKALLSFLNGGYSALRKR